MFIRFDVFGKKMSVLRESGRWLLFADSHEGKRTRIHDVIIPAELLEKDLDIYLADIYHENASPQHPGVTRL